MDWYLGGGRNISQNDDHGDETAETDEMYIYKQIQISIHSQNTGIKKFSLQKNDNDDENNLCTEQMVQILFWKYQ